MNILVVYSHPNPESFNSAIQRLVCNELTSRGHQIELLDLYGDDFDPRLSRQEREGYMGKNNTRHVAHYVQQLQWAEALIMVYPTWWMGPPAILKGWFDRVWLPSVVAEIGPEGITPKLTHIKKIMVITTQGSSKLRMNLLLNPPKIMMKVSLKACTKCKDIQWLALYSMDKIRENKRKRFLLEVKKKLQTF